MSVVSGEAAFLAECAATYQIMEALRTSTITFMELAEKALDEGLKLGRFLLRGWLEGDPRAKPEDEVVCRPCQQAMRIQEWEQNRPLQTALGELHYKRAYAVCDRCGETRVPLDEALGIPPTGPSVEALQRVCHAGVATKSFEGAAEILRVQARLQMSRKHVRCLSEKEGKALVEKRAEEVAVYQGGRGIVGPADPPALIVITADGGRVQTRNKEKKERWREDKIGVVYDAQVQPNPTADKDHYKGAKALTKTHVATMEPWDTIGWMLRVEAEKRGYSKALVKLFLGDGAKSIREMTNLHFPEATFILDWPHAVGHLNESAKAAFGEGTDKARRWYQIQEDRLWEGQRDKIIRDLQTLSKRVGFPTQEDNDFSARTILYRNAFSYFPNNKEAMNYPLFRSKGWPIGSGVVEGAVKQFGLRLKGSEKFWNVSNTGAEEMLALCALYYSEDGRWERYWQARGQPYQKN